jgi:hypothetical protein
MSIRPSEMAMMANVTELMAQTPAARPSMPSMKLTMFMIATTQMRLNGTDTQPSTRVPTTGRVMFSSRTPYITRMPATTNWRPNLMTGLIPRTSSSTPTSVMSDAPTKMPRIVPSGDRKRRLGLITPK